MRVCGSLAAGAHRRDSGFSFLELLMVVTIIGILMAMSTLHLSRFKMAAQEKVVAASLRSCYQGQVLHHSQYRTYATIAELIANNFIDNSFVTDKSGYVFTSPLATENEFKVVALPLEVGISGDRGFLIDHTGVIRYTLDGTEPTPSSPAIW